MKVKNTYIVLTDKNSGYDVLKIMYQTFDGLYFITGHIAGQVYQITKEEAKQLIIK